MWINEISKVDLSKNKYSQSGEELILKFIFENIGTTNNYLIDFGAGDGKYLSNSQLLLESGWLGLRMDGDNKGNEEVKKEFITPENIVSLFEKYSVPGEFDLLSIDLDSCDFQLLQAILAVYGPRLICAEYNPAFEPNESKYLKYEPGYTWDGTTKYGFSLLAGKKLVESFGYTLIYNQKFLNLFFLRNDALPFEELNIEIPNERKIFHPFNSTAEWIEY